MKTEAVTTKEYIESLPEDRQLKIQKLREVITANLPKGFEETMNYGMIGYVVPHSIYPNGYHCDAAMPLPFMNNCFTKKSHYNISLRDLCRF